MKPLILEFLKPFYHLITVSFIVTLIKTIGYLKVTPRKSIREILFEATISIGLGILAGWLTPKNWADYNLLITAGVTYLGSTFDTYFYRILDILVGILKIKIDTKVSKEVENLDSTSNEELDKENSNDQLNSNNT